MASILLLTMLATIDPPLLAPEPPPVAPEELAPQEPEPLLLVDNPPPPPRKPLPLPRIAPKPPTQLPPSVRALIDAAIASGDANAVATLTRFARQTAPWAAPQADALKAGYDADVAEKQAIAARERAEQLAAASFLDNWSGELEFGISRATGNTRALGIYGAAKGEREGLRVRHRFNARADLQETNGQTTTERIIAAYQPNLKFDERLYAYGLAQYERDKFLGYDSRYTLGGGMGYTLFTGPKLRLDLEGGPVVRYTDFNEEEGRTTVAGRASVALSWQIAPTAKLTQSSAIFVESGNTNANSAIALDTKLFGPLKTRLSYNVQYERDAPVGRKSVDTLGRATIVYSF